MYKPKNRAIGIYSQCSFNFIGLFFLYNCIGLNRKNRIDE